MACSTLPKRKGMKSCSSPWIFPFTTSNLMHAIARWSRKWTQKQSRLPTPSSAMCQEPNRKLFSSQFRPLYPQKHLNCTHTSIKGLLNSLSLPTFRRTENPRYCAHTRYTMERLEHFTIGYIWDVPHWHDITMWICFLNYSKKQIPLPMRLFNSWLLLLLLLLVSTKIIYTENSSSVSYLPGSACKDLKLESAPHTENRSPLSITWIDKRTYLFQIVVLSAVSVPASQIQGAPLQAAKVRNRVARNGKRTTAKCNAHTQAHTSLVSLSSVCFFCPSPASLVSDLARLGTSPGLEPQLFWDSQLVWRCLQIRIEAKWDLALFGDLTWFETSSVFVPHLVWDLTWFGASSVFVPHLVWDLTWFETSSVFVPHPVWDLTWFGTSSVFVPHQVWDLTWLTTSTFWVPHLDWDLNWVT